MIIDVKRDRGFWKKPENRRQFLIDLANSKGLDPFKADTWDVITRNDIIKAKVCYDYMIIYFLIIIYH